MTAEFTKSDRAQLRELAERVYEAEARQVLGTLAAEFGDWRRGETDSTGLLQAIDKFHRDDAREFWKTYQGLRDPGIVARGLELGLILASAIPESLRKKLGARESLLRR